MSTEARVTAMIDRALTMAGTSTIESRSFEEGLGILLDDLARSTTLTDFGRGAIEHIVASNLANRFQVEDYARRHPEVRTGQIERPLIVLGMPRTGTTLLSHLLGADPHRRSLLRWETRTSAPPATPDTWRSDPRCEALRQADKAMASSAHAVHHEEADDPSECTFIVAGECKSNFLEALHPVPTYREWLLAADFTSAYAYHRLVLQVLQSGVPGIWNLKMPSHALHIDELLNAYPDARIVWTHRDPYKTTGSLCSLMKLTHSAFSDTDPHAYVGEHYPVQLQAHVDRLMDAEDAGRLHDGNRFNLHYDKMLADPLAMMRRLYAWAGDDLTPEAEAAMQAWLDANPQGKFGRHGYALGDYGLSKDTLAPRFERYLARYTVASEE